METRRPRRLRRGRGAVRRLPLSLAALAGWSRTPVTTRPAPRPDTPRAAGGSPQKRARKEPAKGKGKGKATPPKAKETAQQSMFSFFKRG